MEQIKHDFVSQNYNSDSGIWSVDNYIKVDVKRYKLSLSTYVLLDTFTYYAYDGFGYYSQGYNPLHIPQMPVHLDEKDYYFWSDANNSPAVNQLERAGTFTAWLETGWSVKYTQLQTGLTHSYTIASNNMYNLYRVRPAYYLTGNKVEIFTPTSVLSWEATFYPVEECRYDVITIDFINMYGAWQREFMFKASYESLTTTATEFNLMQHMGLLGSRNQQRRIRSLSRQEGCSS